MKPKEYIKLFDLSYDDVINSHTEVYRKIFESECDKKWLVPIEDKLHLISDEATRDVFSQLIGRLKSNYTFTLDDEPALSIFIAKVNSIVNVADRINNFKVGTGISAGLKLELHPLFNAIKSVDKLSALEYELNSNLKSIIPHLFSVIKNCQDPDLYPVYYRFWKNISVKVRGIKDDYDSLCDLYRTFPVEHRSICFGSYFSTIAELLIRDIRKNDLIDPIKTAQFLRKNVINLNGYTQMLDDIINNRNDNADDKVTKYWLYAPGPNALYWERFYEEGIIGLGWDEMGDLSKYLTREDLKQALKQHYNLGNNPYNATAANYEFANAIQMGDIIIAKKGRNGLLGYGVVISDYYYDEQREEYKSCRKVDWVKKGNWPVNHSLVLKTLTDITSYDSDVMPKKKYHEYLIDIINDKVDPTKLKITINPMINLLKYKKQIILQGPPGTGKTREAKRLTVELLGLSSEEELKKNEQFKLIQFHPSYTYEDFVTGIESRINGDKIEYKAIDKVLGKLAKAALQNYLDSKKEVAEISKENKLNEYFDLFVEATVEELEKGAKKLTENVSLVSVEENAFRYKGNEGWTELGNRMLFRDIKQAFSDGNKERQDLKNNDNISGLAKQHASYFVRVLNMFKSFLERNKLDVDERAEVNKVVEKKYVLIIDEINRANLSSVLGELIYALEYRGEDVESMYKVDGSDKLVLPPNLYIIGTMNTADRSVGHIDYAIRRRFAFVDVLPKNLKETDRLYSFDENLFNKVASLFSTNLSPEFEKNDVQLGHSYFIDKSDEEHGADMNMRWDYEIKPILLEYVRDGILIGENIRNIIESLETSR